MASSDSSSFQEEIVSLDENLPTFMINDQGFKYNPLDFPERCTLRVMYEGDKTAGIYTLKNKLFIESSIFLIINILTKNVKVERINNFDVDIVNVNLLVNYLNLGNSIDFIHPMFLTPSDRIDWYKECQSRLEYSENDTLDVVKYSEMKLYESDYITLGCATNPKWIDDSYLLKSIRHIPGLFVVGGYALHMFDEKNIIKYSDIDIFAYGPDSLVHVREAVGILISIKDGSSIPIRTEYSITIPSGDEYCVINIQFILLKSRSRYEILNRFDVDSCCIGFDIYDRTKFYALPRFTRAFETKTNVVDPTRQSPTYVGRLLKYLARGFKIGIPGIAMLKNVVIKSDIMKNIIMFSGKDRTKILREMKLDGLEALIVSISVERNVSSNTLRSDYEIGCYHDTEEVLKNVLDEMHTRFVAAGFEEGFDTGGTKTFTVDVELPFVVHDILNEDEFSFEMRGGTFLYTPKNPKIKFMDGNVQDGMSGSINQVLTSFYGGYYNL